MKSLASPRSILIVQLSISLSLKVKAKSYELPAVVVYDVYGLIIQYGEELIVITTLTTN